MIKELKKDNILSNLHKKLKDNHTYTLDNMIYLSDKMYLLENGDIVQIE